MSQSVDLSPKAKAYTKLIMKRFILYLIRWQLSSPILALCMWLMGDWNIAIATIIANLIGGCIFYWVDLYIFKGKT